MQEFLRNNWGLIVTLLIVASFFYYMQMREEVVARENQCWLTNLDKEGIGFSFPTDYCVQLKIQCESSTHNIPCEWWNDSQSKGSCVCKMI